jgi:hypothetical protein
VPEEQRAEQVAHRDHREVVPGASRRHVEERLQDLRVPERDRVVQERLPDEQRQPERRPARVAGDQRVRDPGEPDRLALVDRQVVVDLGQ